MIWAQAFACFFVWIAYGVVQARRSDHIRTTLSAMTRGKRTALGALLMVFGIAILAGGFIGAQAVGGFTKTGLTPFGWVLVAFFGLLFVHAQTLAMAMMVSLLQESVTSAQSPPSDQQRVEGTQS